jgi:hypothetical protein
MSGCNRQHLNDHLRLPVDNRERETPLRGFPRLVLSWWPALWRREHQVHSLIEVIYNFYGCTLASLSTQVNASAGPSSLPGRNEPEENPIRRIVQIP